MNYYVQQLQKMVQHLDILHVCIVKLFSKMLVFLQKINDFSEVAVIM